MFCEHGRVHVNMNQNIFIHTTVLYLHILKHVHVGENSLLDPGRSDLEYDSSHSEELFEVNQEALRRQEQNEFQDYNITTYAANCRNSLYLEPNKKIKIMSPYHGEKQYPGGLDCNWEIIAIGGCTPAITCETVDLRKLEDCIDELIISDGGRGEERLCGPNLGFTHFTTAAQGEYLYISFKTGDSAVFDKLYRGIKCSVHCEDSVTVQLEKLVILPKAPPRKEEFSRLCGTKYDEGQRIVGGEDGNKGEFPWLVALVANGTRQPFCGASLINSRTVLTAAHCLIDAETRQVHSTGLMQVLLKGYLLDKYIHDTANQSAELSEDFTKSPGHGANDEPDKSEIIVEIEEMRVHPFYNRFAVEDSDIGLVRLKEDLSFKNEDIPTPVCLPDLGQPLKTYEGVRAIVAGWGKVNFKASTSTRLLQKVEVPVLQLEDCKAWYKEKNIVVTDNMLCAGYEAGEKDACSGDSGGPLITKEGNRWVQIGVVSFGDECAIPKRPGIYTRVSEYLPWINHHSSRGATWARNE